MTEPVYMSPLELRHHVRISHHLDREMSAEEHQARHDQGSPDHYHLTDAEGRVTRGSYTVGGCEFCGARHPYRINCGAAQARWEGVDVYHPEGSVIDPTTGMTWGETRIVPRGKLARDRSVR